MYCPKCGTQNDDNAYKCTKCGIIIQQVAAVKKSNAAVVALVIAVVAMVFFAVVGILAAIAIPAYLDYSVKAKITQVLKDFDTISEKAADYYAKNDRFPAQNDLPYDLAPFSQTLGQFSCAARASNDDITYRFTFNNAISSSINGCTLDMRITYKPDIGYEKKWLSTSTLPKKYMPRQ
jgi:Tfp pilus assembly protein PilE